MTVTELRNKLVRYAQSYLGAKQGDAKHKKIIDIFNSIKPLPDGWSMNYSAAWCAAFVSACAHACGFDSIIPESANCGVMMTKAMKIYQEGTGKSGSYGMWNHPRGHIWNVFVRPASS